MLLPMQIPSMPGRITQHVHTTSNNNVVIQQNHSSVMIKHISWPELGLSINIFSCSNSTHFLRQFLQLVWLNFCYILYPDGTASQTSCNRWQIWSFYLAIVVTNIVVLVVMLTMTNNYRLFLSNNCNILQDESEENNSLCSTYIPIKKSYQITIADDFTYQCLIRTVHQPIV